MAYQVLARKWRPQDFDSVVGQEPVVTALQNALGDGRVAQAYLFSGIRGVGKTSVARVFAKALNCENDPPSDPCNDCTSCSEIAAGADLDVLEIDAATYSKVEQVRELTESLRYGPARDKYKVVIIDEIHRLSRQAFDALLKIVEEPPEHLVFMFATTEIEAVPATILSRCQSFQLRRVPLVEMVDHLRRISEAEDLGASDIALRLIARAGEGSVRDAVALLDQIATFGGGKVADDEVSRVLGGADLAVYQGLLHAILAGESDKVSEVVREIENQGWDPRHIYGEFLAYCRDALHLVLDPEAAAIELPAEEAEALRREASGAGYENLLRLLHLLLDSEMGVRRSESASLALEIALLRAAELPKLVAIEELLGGGGQQGDGATRSGGGGATPRSGAAGTGAQRKASAPLPSSAEASAPPPADPDEPAPTRQAEPTPDEPTPEPPEATPPDPAQPVPAPDSAESELLAAQSEPSEPSSGHEPAAPADEPEPEPDESPRETLAPDERESVESRADSSDPAGALEERAAAKPAPDSTPPKAPPGSSKAVAQLLERVSYLKQPLAAHLGGAESLVIKGDVLVIATHPGDTVLERTLSRSSNRRLLDRTVAEMFGPAASWRLEEGTGVAAEASSESNGEHETDDVTRDPTVQAVLDLFGGQIESIEPRPNPSDR